MRRQLITVCLAKKFASKRAGSHSSPKNFKFFRPTYNTSQASIKLLTKARRGKGKASGSEARDWAGGQVPHRWCRDKRGGAHASLGERRARPKGGGGRRFLAFRRGRILRGSQPRPHRQRGDPPGRPSAQCWASARGAGRWDSSCSRIRRGAQAAQLWPRGRKHGKATSWATKNLAPNRSFANAAESPGLTPPHL